MYKVEKTRNKRLYNVWNTTVCNFITMPYCVVLNFSAISVYVTDECINSCQCLEDVAQA